VREARYGLLCLSRNTALGLVGSRHPGPLAQRERVSLTRRRSLVQIQYGPPVCTDKSNTSNTPRGPSGSSRAKRLLSSPRLSHCYGSLLNRCCPGNDSDIPRSARYSRGAARRLTIWRTWLADRSPPCRVQNSRWRPLTPSLRRSASQSCTTGVWLVRGRVPAPARGMRSGLAAPIRRRASVRAAAMTMYPGPGLLSHEIERGASASSCRKSERTRGLGDPPVFMAAAAACWPQPVPSG
jgi:hypothetical protein